MIHGVASGIFPIKFAIQVATTDDSQNQNILMDAIDDGVVTTKNFGQARRIITARSKQVKRSLLGYRYRVASLNHDIAHTTRVKTSYVREAKMKECCFMTLLSGINAFFQDATLVALPRDQELENRPDLAREVDLILRNTSWMAS